MSDIKAPFIPSELLVYLQTVYPPKPLDISISDRQIWIDAGIQRVIAHLIKVHDSQISRGDSYTCVSQTQKK